MSKTKMKDSAPESNQNSEDMMDLDFESKIEAAMAKIVQDTLAEREEFYPDEEESEEIEDVEEADTEEQDDSEDEEDYFDEADDSFEYNGNLILPVAEDDDDDFEPEDQTETEEPSDEENQPDTNRKKSARPDQITYVPVPEVKDTHTAEAPAEVAPEEPAKEPEKKHKGLKVTGLLAAMLVVTAGTAYAGMSYYYSNRFFEGTTINGEDCSRMTAYEVEQKFTEKLKGYSIEVQSRNLAPQTIAGSAINYNYISNGEVLDCLKSQKPYEWIKGYIEPTSYEVQESSTYDKELLKDELRKLECAKAENQVQPENAYVAYADNYFDIVPETEGSALNIKQAYQILEQAVSDSQEEIDFTAEPDAYFQADILSTDEGLIQSREACNNFARASITYDMGDTSVTLDGSVIKDWLEFDDKNQLVQDESVFAGHIKEYVRELAEQYDTVGTTREFLTTSGRTVYVYGTAYGWMIDQEAEAAQLAEDIANGVEETREPIYAMRANARGYNDIGDTYIEVDLAYQHMYYYQYGSCIFDCDFVSGNPNLGRQTPPGIFTLYYKTSPSVLRGDMDENGNYGYETPVTYWMPFNGGVGFHDATWQPYYGGDLYLWNGSHGCINLSYNSAAYLYSIIECGVPILVFN